MANPHLQCAIMHLRTVPGETRTLEQLEAHYLSLSMGSVFAPIVLAIKTEEAESDALMDAKCAINNAMRQEAST